MASPEASDGTELQLTLNNNPAAKAYRQAIFQEGQPAAMFFTDDVKGDYERIKSRRRLDSLRTTKCGRSANWRSSVGSDPLTRMLSIATTEKGDKKKKMTNREQCTPDAASGAQVRKDGEEWTLILVRELRHAPEKVWQALPDPAHLRECAPFEADGGLATAGATVNLTWVGTGRPQVTTVTRADAPEVLEYGDIQWQLEAFSGGTRLRLWHKIDRRFISWGAAGWHICFDVLDRLLSGTPIGRIVGPEAMKFGGWQRLNAEYAKQFGVETPGWPPNAPKR